MGRDKRLYPISEEKFTEVVLPLREARYQGKGLKFPITRYFEVCSLF
jgi:hypothetical protein